MAPSLRLEGEIEIDDQVKVLDIDVVRWLSENAKTENSSRRGTYESLDTKLAANLAFVAILLFFPTTIKSGNINVYRFLFGGYFIAMAAGVVALVGFVPRYVPLMYSRKMFYAAARKSFDELERSALTQLLKVNAEVSKVVGTKSLLLMWSGGLSVLSMALYAVGALIYMGGGLRW